MAKSHSGGGRTEVRTPVRTGRAASGVSAGDAARIGRKTHTPVPAERTPMPAGGSAPLGNQVALNVGRGGPGAGRTVLRTGSQGTHGPVNAGLSPTRRDILSEFGPERSRG
jgi:hypothetical protein